MHAFWALCHFVVWKLGLVEVMVGFIYGDVELAANITTEIHHILGATNISSWHGQH